MFPWNSVQSGTHRLSLSSQDHPFTDFSFACRNHMKYLKPYEVSDAPHLMYRLSCLMQDIP